MISVKVGKIQFQEALLKLQAGKYVVIDPCHVFGDNNAFWDDFVDFSFPNDSPERKSFTVVMDGVRWFTWSTKHGGTGGSLAGLEWMLAAWRSFLSG